MTATHETLARPSSLSDAATAIFAMLGLIDVALAGVIGSPGAPPRRAAGCPATSLTAPAPRRSSRADSWEAA